MIIIPVTWRVNIQAKKNLWSHHIPDSLQERPVSVLRFQVHSSFPATISSLCVCLCVSVCVCVCVGLSVCRVRVCVCVRVRVRLIYSYMGWRRIHRGHIGGGVQPVHGPDLGRDAGGGDHVLHHRWGFILKLWYFTGFISHTEVNGNRRTSGTSGPTRLQSSLHWRDINQKSILWATLTKKIKNYVKKSA